LFFLRIAPCLYGDLQDVQEISPPQWVSLGSHCEVAWYLGNNDLRTAAYPFDWLLTLDHSTCLSLIQEEFLHFMDEAFLVPGSGGNVINTYYSVDFRHDWLTGSIEEHMPTVRDKYQRRIKRFFKLADYPGKVYFIRSAFDKSLNPSLPTITEGCSVVTFEQAQSLRNLLLEKFPQLDFELVILNYAEEMTEDIQGLYRVTEFKISKANRAADYRQILNTLQIQFNNSEVN